MPPPQVRLVTPVKMQTEKRLRLFNDQVLVDRLSPETKLRLDHEQVTRWFMENLEMQDLMIY